MAENFPFALNKQLADKLRISDCRETIPMPMTAPVLTPPLCDGDRLTRDEFMRRWEAMPDLKWAELLNGVVYMPSPISLIHSDFHSSLNGWLWTYATTTPGCASNSAGTWLMTSDSAPQPDLALRILPEFGGQSTIEGKYAAGAPELIVEVSPTTSIKDTGVKFRLYERSAVREYLIVRPAKHKLIWNILVEGKFQELAADDDGLFRSRMFPGLWLNPSQLWDGDLAGIAATVRQGAAKSEHTAFVRKLARNKR
jgi:Uma2 family endonuclease